MGEIVKCKGCDAVLAEPFGDHGEEREPCPNCGYRERIFHVSASFTVQTDVVSSAEVVSLPSLLVKAIVVPGQVTDEGLLITAISAPWLEIIELLAKDPALAYKIPSRKWEEIIAGAYKRAGFDEVTLTPRSGDLGRDIIAVKAGIGVVRIIDQVKAYSPGHLVTADDVRALVGVLYTDGASKGFLTTTSDFAPNLKKDPLIVPLIPSRLDLINGTMLLKRLRELAEGH
jgi:restriction system protein